METTYCIDGTRRLKDLKDPPDRSMLEEISDTLAKATLDALDGSDDDTLQKKVADAIGNSSPTLQEAYNTALRIRRAEAKALAIIREFGGR